MTLSHHIGLRGTPYSIIVTEDAAQETAEGTFGTDDLASSLDLTEAYVETGNFVYSATAEGRTGEVANAESAIDLDATPGLIYNGPSGVGYAITIAGLDVSEGTIAPEATDRVTAALMVNNEILAFADEGYVAELDTETAVAFNIATYAALTEGDVVRVALIGGGEEVSDWDVAVGGTGDEGSLIIA